MQNRAVRGQSSIAARMVLNTSCHMRCPLGFVTYETVPGDAHARGWTRLDRDRLFGLPGRVAGSPAGLSRPEGGRPPAEVDTAVAPGHWRTGRVPGTVVWLVATAALKRSPVVACAQDATMQKNVVFDVRGPLTDNEIAGLTTSRRATGSASVCGRTRRHRRGPLRGRR